MEIFFSVGEPSGDLHGANLIRELRSMDSGIECVGFGGPRMAAAGMELHRDLTRLAVMMLWNALIKVPQFYRIYRSADRYFREHPVDAVVLIDFPGFNWWIAKAAKRHGIQTIYYGVPQMWAWAPWRIGKLRKRVDHVICKLPFEQKWFERRGVSADFVGHPYIDELLAQRCDEQFLADYDDRETRLLTLLPGSRDQEVRDNLEWMLEAAAEVGNSQPELCVAIACFDQRHADYARQKVRQMGLPFDVMHGRTAELIRLADVCLACSGSVSLELMFHGKPAVIVYRLSWLQGFFKQLLLEAPYITLVNLLWLGDLDRCDFELPHPESSEVPFPEFARRHSPVGEMAGHLQRLLTDSESADRTRKQLKQIAQQLEPGGASRKAARMIIDRCRGSESISEMPIRRAA